MPIFAGLLGVVGFSLNDLLVRALGHQVSLWVIVTSTTGALCLLSFVWLCVKRQGFLPRNFVGWPLVFGLTSAFNIIASVMTFRCLSVAEGYLLVFTYPVWTAIIDGLIQRRFYKRHVLPLALAVAGVFFVYCQKGFIANLGIFWGLLCAFMCAINIVIARHLHGESLFKLSFSKSLFCLIVGLTGLLWGHALVFVPAPTLVWQLPALIVCSVGGSLGALFASQRLPPVRSALLFYLQIPVAVFLAWLLMHEAVTPRVAMGLVLIVAGSATAQLQGIKAQKAKVVVSTGQA